ncbi:hypothetical protein B5M09_010858 [Aphanomyces astaci]|uniref:Peptidase M14 domain-containing protein n=1 Tax=Aphanomyces astaci TaxID=112090 RepID=A0A3R7YH60_APHAT|nr:hypothetical protein B5M09_010858 [Aphanomyces astaci]
MFTINVDGYDISWTKGKRLQRKNANEVDLNRNWPARFDHPENDKDPTNETYHGTGALSEPETTGIDEWLKKKNSEISGWVDVHSYAGKTLYPNGDTKELIGTLMEFPGWLELTYRLFLQQVMQCEALSV